MMKFKWHLASKNLTYCIRFKNPSCLCQPTFNSNAMRTSHIHHATERNVVISTNKPVESFSEDTTLPKYLFENIHRYPEHRAVTCGITGRSYTFTGLYKASRCFAATLRRRLKVQESDVVGVALPNGLEYPVAVFGALMAGAVVSPLNPASTSEELRHQLSIINAKVLITSTHNFNAAASAIESLKKNITVIIVNDLENSQPLPPNAMDFKEFSENSSIDTDPLKYVKRTIDDLAFLPFSSGTTGLPKAVELTHKNIIINSEQMINVKSKFVLPTEKDFQDCILSVLPQFHIYELNGCLITKLRAGVHVVALPGFTPTSFLKTLLEYRPTMMQAVPLLIQFMGAHPAVTPEHLASMRVMCCGAAPLTPVDRQRFYDKFNNKIGVYQGYGLTESSPLLTLQEFDDTDPFSVGGPVSNTELKVVDIDTGEVLGCDQRGELLVRGPQVMRGYHGDVTSTRTTLTTDGWLRTGDIASYNSEHRFYITDRIKELIKVKGYQVPPAELEGILKEHPSVSDAAVVAIPDLTSGEVPKAYVVTNSGNKVTKQELIDFVAGKVSEYKKIVEVQFVDSIPKSASGKILRRLLRSDKL